LISCRCRPASSEIPSHRAATVSKRSSEGSVGAGDGRWSFPGPALVRVRGRPLNRGGRLALLPPPGPLHSLPAAAQVSSAMGRILVPARFSEGRRRADGTGPLLLCRLAKTEVPVHERFRARGTPACPATRPARGPRGPLRELHHALHKNDEVL
jgi:hypothetical protein